MSYSYSTSKLKVLGFGLGLFFGFGVFGVFYPFEIPYNFIIIFQTKETFLWRKIKSYESPRF